MWVENPCFLFLKTVATANIYQLPFPQGFIQSSSYTNAEYIFLFQDFGRVQGILFAQKCKSVKFHFDWEKEFLCFFFYGNGTFKFPEIFKNIFLFDQKPLNTINFNNSGADNQTDTLGLTLQPTNLSGSFKTIRNWVN